MARAIKLLTNLNDEIIIVNPSEDNGAASIQYGAGGLGTVVMEISSLALNGAWQWVTIQMIDSVTRLPVANLAAVGHAWAELVGVAAVRVRKSVAGGGGVNVALTLNTE